MNILLPKEEEFYYEFSKEKVVFKKKKNSNTNEYEEIRYTIKKIVYIEDGILKIEKGILFEKLMYALTKCIYEKKCWYCFEELSDEEITMDHVYPRDMGGPTLSNNLVIACGKCNSEKTNMNYEQYMQYRQIHGKKEKKRFLRNLELNHDFIRKTKGMGIPEEWYTQVEVKSIKCNDLEEIQYTKLYKKIENQYLEYGTFKYPCIISRNNFCLGSKEVYKFAKKNGINFIPTIRLDNVEILE